MRRIRVVRSCAWHPHGGRDSPNGFSGTHAGEHRTKPALQSRAKPPREARSARAAGGRPHRRAFPLKPERAFGSHAGPGGGPCRILPPHWAGVHSFARPAACCIAVPAPPCYTPLAMKSGETSAPPGSGSLPSAATLARRGPSSASAAACARSRHGIVHAAFPRFFRMNGYPNLSRWIATCPEEPFR